MFVENATSNSVLCIDVVNWSVHLSVRSSVHNSHKPNSFTDKPILMKLGIGVVYDVKDVHEGR